MKSTTLAALLLSGAHPVRAVEVNIADLKAQVASCAKGAEEIRRMVAQFGREVVDARAISGTVGLESGQVTLPGLDVEGKIETTLADALADLNLTSLVGQERMTRLGSSSVPVAFDSMKAGIDLNALPWKLEGLRLARDGGALNGSGAFDPLAGTVRLGIDVERRPRG